MIKRPEFLIQSLVLIASEERDLLGEGNWEAALEMHEQFDEQFAQLQRCMLTANPLDAKTTNEMQRLMHLFQANLELYKQFRSTAGEKLSELTKVAQIAAYAPMGRSNQPSPRYIDGSG